MVVHPETPDKETPGLALSAVLLTGLFALGMSSGLWVLIGPMVAAVVLHPFLRGRVNVSLGYMGYLLLALPFAGLSRGLPADGQTISQEFGTMTYNFAFYISMYLFAVALLRLYRSGDTSRAAWAVMSGGWAVAVAGVDLRGAHYRWVLLVFGVALVMLLRRQVVAARPGRTGAFWRRAVVTTALVCSAFASAGVVYAIEVHYGALTQLAASFLFDTQLVSNPGFSDNARLGSIEQMRTDSAVAEDIAVRAFASRAPGYLRGRTFTTYEDGQWVVLQWAKGKWVMVQWKEDRPVRDGDIDARTGRYVLPEREAPAAGVLADMDVYPAERYRAHFFLPLQTAAIDTQSGTLQRYVGSILKSKHVPTSVGYEVFLDAAPVTSEAAEGMLGVPEGAALREQLDLVISSFGEEPATPQAAVQAITSYFVNKYEYRIGIEFTDGEDPIIQFLRDKRHGHCELFATAGTLLLRRLGHAARYVTGFVCEEPNGWGDLYVARNRHGHAWTEVFVPGMGWRTVDFTPASGQPVTTSCSSGLAEYIGGLWAWLTGVGLRGLIDLFVEALAGAGQWVLGAWYRVAPVALLVGWLLARRFLHPRARERKSYRESGELPQELARDRERFLAIERRFARRGYQRYPAEGLDEYAARLADASLADREDDRAFVVAYARLRFSPVTSRPDPG